MLAADVARCRASCWRSLLPRWLLTWLDSMMDTDVDTCTRTMMCRYLIGPHVVVWFVHMHWSGWSTCHALVGPHVIISLVHVSWSDWSSKFRHNLWRNYVRSCIRQNISQLMAFIYIYTTHSKFSKSGPCGNNYTAQRGNNYTTHIKLNSTILEITKKNNRSIACLLIPNPQPVASNMSIAWWSLILNLKETLPNNCQCAIFEIEITNMLCTENCKYMHMLYHTNI
jgi:hypothetical protein